MSQNRTTWRPDPPHDPDLDVPCPTCAAEEGCPACRSASTGGRAGMRTAASGRDHLVDALQEALDLWVYLRAANAWGQGLARLIARDLSERIRRRDAAASR